MTFKDLDQLKYWSVTKEELLSILEAKETGLSEKEAQDRLKIFGPNELAKKKKNGFILKFLSKFANPLVLILLFASFISALLGETTNFIIISAIVVLSGVLDFYQEYRAENAAEKLRKKVSLTATVLRDGIKKEISHSGLVVGDVVLLSVGDIVPADCRLLSANDFLVNQSSLTGESYPQEKKVDTGASEHALVIDRINSIFMGTTVALGEATAIVVKVGNKTEFGKIEKELLVKRPETEFQKGLKSFGYMIMKLTFILVIFVFFVNALIRHEIVDSFLFSLALAIGLAPELLPMIITINLSRGAVRMSKKGVIVKDLQAIENFGSMEVLCTDKTGTLTEGKTEYIGGEDIEEKENKLLDLYGFLNGIFQAGFKSPMEKAIVEKIRNMNESNDFRKVDELSFDFERKRLSIIYEENGNKDKFLLITNGAPEEIFKLCDNLILGERKIRLTEEKKEKIKKRFNELSSQGIRILAVAFKEVQSKREYSLDDESNLTFLGLLKFYDPPKTTVHESIANLINKGIELKILTGDNELVTRKVCSDIGLLVKKSASGEMIDQVNDDELFGLVRETTIFTRLSPQQKVRIILALKKNNLVVGFLGDGINDATSLRAADIGISVNNAVDVAKESADLILLKRDLKVLGEGVIEGRKTHGNVMKYIMMGSSSDFGNMFSLASASLFLPFLPMLPVQILLNDLLYDITQLVIPSDNVDKVYEVKPKKWDIKFIKRFMFIFGPISSVFDLLTFFLLYFVLRASTQLFQSGWFVESIVTQSLIVLSIRTSKTPFYKSKPSLILLSAILLIVFVGLIFPLSPLAELFMFTKLPPKFYLMLVLIIISYGTIVEFTKKWFYKKYPL